MGEYPKIIVLDGLPAIWGVADGKRYELVRSEDEEKQARALHARQLVEAKEAEELVKRHCAAEVEG